MNTHRANLGSDTEITCWVRDVDGKRDLSGFTLSVLLYPYGSSTDLGLTIAATSPADGKVLWTMSAADADAYLCAGSYRFVVKGVDGSDSETLYSGLLEAV